MDDRVINFHHDEKDKRIAFVDPYFTTHELVKMKESKALNNDALYNELTDIEPYLKFIPSIGNIVNQMALRPKILEYIAKILSIKEKSSLPLVIIRREIDGQSPIDTACEKN